jgi:hypothetical protein
MTKLQLEKLLLKAANVARERDFFLIGSQALRGISPSIPRDFPATEEADLYPRRNPQAWNILRMKLGKASAFFKRNGYYLDCTDPALSTLPEGWLERLIPFRTPRTRDVTAWCLEAHDLFVSKMVAWREKDQLYLAAMLRHKLAKVAVILTRIEELPVSNSEKQELTKRLQHLNALKRRNRNKRKKN